MTSAPTTLDLAVDGYQSAQGEQRQPSLRALLSEIKKAASTAPPQAAVALARLIQPDLDYATAEAFTRLRKLLRATRPTPASQKIAIVGTFTTHQLTALLDLFLFAHGIEVDIYEADYGLVEQEILDTGSGLRAFQPDVIFIATNRRSLIARPAFDEDRQHVAGHVTDEVAKWSALWKVAHESLGCQIIQNNFEQPMSRVLGNHEMRHHTGLARFISHLNHALQDAAPAFVTIHDVDHLAASAGRWAWGDERFFYHAKLPCAPEYLVGYAHSVASIIAAHTGHAKKCLVLDLDNTLWGGVIGDDGLGGIRLGQGEAEGEAFQAFQHYVRDLSRRGVILAVCSKNDERIAREVFEKHSEMVLHLDDIACFVANWDDKATNLRRIARQLDIGLNSLVFVDDNPAERSIVRQLVPEVAVPEMPDDPSGYIYAVERHAYFQPVSVGTEDLQRSAMYRANTQRQQAESSAASIDAFLKSLDMNAVVEPVGPANIERVAQLISRSNQFNLTTRRHSPSAVQSMTADPQSLALAVSLTDRFGNNGLISVLLAKIVDEKLLIDTWLMSCRVLKRGVEAFLLNEICDHASSRGCKVVMGEYIPTPKNELVKHHYPALGFEKVSENSEGRTVWQLALPAVERPTFIKKVASSE